MSHSVPYKSFYRAEVDGLRGFAVLSVVAYHAFPGWLGGGFVGVDVFFVISGFLITSHIFESIDNREFSFAEFFGRRIRRIFPALIVVMACSLAFGWFVLLADEYSQLGKHVASGAAFVTNFILVDESGYFDNSVETKPMLHLWSLAVEEQFYIVWPFVLWLAWKCRLSLLKTTILFAVCSFVINLNLVKSYPVEVFFWPLGRFWELLSGSILAWFLLYKSEVLSELKLTLDKYIVAITHSKGGGADGLTITNLMSVAGLLFLVYGVIRIDDSVHFPSTWALIPVLGTVLIISSGSNAWLNRTLLMNPVAVWFGVLSYPLYLWHWPILSFLRIIEGEIPTKGTRILAVFLSIILAWITYNFIEKPVRFGRRKGLNSIMLIGVIFAVGSVGLYVNISDGVTPINSRLKFVSEAKGDWAYPEGLVNRGGYWATSENPSTVLMFGDSTIEAFTPRIVDQYQKGVIEEVAIATIGGCAPLPNAYRNNSNYIVKCEGHFDQFYKVLESNPIEVVILGGAYFPYFDGTEPSVFVDSQGREFSIPSGIGRKKAFDAFLDFIEKLSEEYEVVVISHAVSSPNFSPSNILGAGSKGRSIPLTDGLNTEPFKVDNKLEVEIQHLLKPLNVDFLSQSEKICPNGLCFPLTKDGKPKYKDSYHMRPFFAIQYMDVLDPYVVLSK